VCLLFVYKKIRIPRRLAAAVETLTERVTERFPYLHIISYVRDTRPAIILYNIVTMRKRMRLRTHSVHTHDCARRWTWARLRPAAARVSYCRCPLILLLLLLLFQGRTLRSETPRTMGRFCGLFDVWKIAGNVVRVHTARASDTRLHDNIVRQVQSEESKNAITIPRRVTNVLEYRLQIAMDRVCTHGRESNGRRLAKRILVDTHKCWTKSKCVSCARTYHVYATF